MRSFDFLLPILLLGCGDTTGEPIFAANPDADGGQPQQPEGGQAQPDGGQLQPDAAPSGPAALVVASSLGLLVWNDAAALTADRAPDVTLSNVADGTALAASGARLYVGAGHPAAGATGAVVLAFDAPLTPASRATATVGRNGQVAWLAVDGADRLWSDESISVSVFSGASSLASTAAPIATFTHPWQQIPSFAYEPTGDRLFAGQISGAGVLAWNQSSAKTGSPTNDFKLADGAYWTMQLEGGRLYAAGAHPDLTNGVAIWPNAGGLSGAAAPIVVTSGYVKGKFISHLVVANDVLAVAARDQDAILVYKKASAIGADAPPDFTITDPSMKAPSHLALDGAGRLYAVDQDGVLVFRDVTTAPALVAEIKSGVGSPAAVLLQ